jgi:hypothetical protein
MTWLTERVDLMATKTAADVAKVAHARPVHGKPERTTIALTIDIDVTSATTLIQWRDTKSFMEASLPASTLLW